VLHRRFGLIHALRSIGSSGMVDWYTTTLPLLANMLLLKLSLFTLDAYFFLKFLLPAPALLVLFPPPLLLYLLRKHLCLQLSSLPFTIGMVGIVTE
jgi:hypothetical protein